MSCEFCEREGARPIVLDESDLGGRIRIGWIDSEPVLMAGTKLGYEISAPIRFCPMCGRELAEVAG